MGTTAEMEQFLAGVEKRAFRIARFAVSHHEDALEIVQEAMIKLVQRYSSSSPEEWAPLFYRILESRIRDHQRRQKVRNKIHDWFGFGADDTDENPIDTLPARADADPANRHSGDETLDAVESAIGKLPLRQQQAFLLRASSCQPSNILGTDRSSEASLRDKQSGPSRKRCRLSRPSPRDTGSRAHRRAEPSHRDHTWCIQA